MDRTDLAVIADGLWFAVSCFLFLLTLIIPHAIGAAGIFTVWGFAALTGTALILQRTRIRPGLIGWPQWIRGWDRVRAGFGAEASFGAISSLVFASAVTALLGANGTAALRGSATVLGPLSLLINSLPMIIVPELRRLGRIPPSIMFRRLTPLAWSMTGLAVAIGISSFFIPQRYGAFALGASWTVVQPIIWITALEYVGHSWLAIGSTLLRSLARSRDLFRLRLLLSGAAPAASLLVALGTHDLLLVAATLALGAAATAAVSARMCLVPKSRMKA